MSPAKVLVLKRMGMVPRDSIPTRQSLLDRLKAVDNGEGWREFFETYWALIYNMAVRFGLNDAEAQDVVQRTIISVAKAMPRFQYDPKLGSFKSWLRKLTHREVLAHFRAQKRAPLPVGGPESPQFSTIVDESDSSFEEIWNEEWRSAILSRAAERTKARVDTKHFQIFDLCTLRNRPPREVAEMLKVNRANVYLANHRVGRIFDEELKKIDLDNEL